LACCTYVSHVIEYVSQTPHNRFTTLVLRKHFGMLQDCCKDFQPSIVSSYNPSPTELRQTMEGSIMAKAEGLSGTSKQPQISVRTPIDVDGEGVLFAIYLAYPLAYFFF